MAEVFPTPKYPLEVFLEFQSIDRFIYRVSDLKSLEDWGNAGAISRLGKCNIYLLSKRPRLSLVPGSVRTDTEIVTFEVEYRQLGQPQRAPVRIRRSAFRPEEIDFAASDFPHRELITRDQDGNEVAKTLLANMVHLIPDLPNVAKDLEVVYVGQGVSKDAQDRLKSHSTLQDILADLNSNSPDDEVFVVVYSFKMRKNGLGFSNKAKATREEAERFLRAVKEYSPSNEEQVDLIEATLISYFYTSRYNSHHLEFPTNRPKLLQRVLEVDFAAIAVELDNTNIGNQRTYSERVPPSSEHVAYADLRALEGKQSVLSQLKRPS